MESARKRSAFIALAGFIGLLLLAATPSWAQQGSATITATAQVNVNLRSGPDRNYPIVGTVPAGSVLTVSARSSDSSWLLAISQRGQRGWVSARQLKLSSGAVVTSLAISSEIMAGSAPYPQADQGNSSVTSPSSPEQTPTLIPAAPGDPSPYAAQITPAIRAAMHRIYLQGLALGNNPRVFAKVGDCLEGFIWFLFQYGDGNPYDLSPYNRLQAVIDHFMVSPRTGVANPYVEQSQAAHPAFTSASVQDPEWTDPGVCQPNETPLICEYRIDKPSVAIIMFGVVDVESLTAAQFNSSMRAVVQQTLARGIIPIMSTAPENLAYGDKAAQFNHIVTQIAAENSIPLIHLRDALYPLASHGLDHDGLHLTPGAGWGRVAFTPTQLQLGLPVWNLLALESLDNVWRQIMN